MISPDDKAKNDDGMTLKATLGPMDSFRRSPGGKSPSLWEQAVRLALFIVWFDITCIAIVATQFLGVPLAFYDKNIFYA